MKNGKNVTFFERLEYSYNVESGIVLPFFVALELWLGLCQVVRIKLSYLSKILIGSIHAGSAANEFSSSIN